MTSNAYDFSTPSDRYDVAERGIIGIGGGKPIVRIRIGLSLLRALYEYGSTGLIIGQLQAAPARPSAVLPAMNPITRVTLAPGLTQTVLAADPVAPSTLAFLSDHTDDIYCHGVGIDGTYTPGTVALPEIKAWCEALGGTYSPEIPQP